MPPHSVYLVVLWCILALSAHALIPDSCTCRCDGFTSAVTASDGCQSCSGALCTQTFSQCSRAKNVTAKCAPAFPIVINTWPFTAATAKAWEVISASINNTPSNSSISLDAVEQGCSVCEAMQCDGTVGFGGSPDTNGETTLDAMIMDGTSMNVGAVGDLREIKHAISTARHVLHNTKHTLLAGTQAADFAVEMGLGPKQSLTTANSQRMYNSWRDGHCQPNYYVNVMPNHTTSCGPYKPADAAHPVEALQASQDIRIDNHDTIGMLVLDTAQHLVSGTSTNGANHKVAGRVGDSPIMGAGSYADSKHGGCAATGDGDTMMRFLPCFRAVQSMRNGMTPNEAAEDAIRAIRDYYPDYTGALITLNTKGEYGAAGWGWTFTFSVRTLGTGEVVTVAVPPIKN